MAVQLVILSMKNASDIMPWLFVSKSAHASAVLALSQATLIQWPLPSCSALQPRTGLLHSLLQLSATTSSLPLHLSLTFCQETTGGTYSEVVEAVNRYMKEVLHVVDSLALPRLSSLDLHCTNCEHGLYNSFEWISSRLRTLVHLSITSTIDEEMGVWGEPLRLAVEQQLPNLQHLIIDISEVATARVSFFDSVKTLELSGRVFSMDHPRDTIAGCFWLEHLILRRPLALSEWSMALSYPQFRERVEALRRIDVHFGDQHAEALNFIALLASLSMRLLECVCAYVRFVPENLLPTMLQGLPSLSGLCLAVQEHVSEGVSMFRFVISSDDDPNDRRRTRAISIGRCLLLEHHVLLGVTTTLCNLAPSLRRIELPISLIPWLLKLVGAALGGLDEVCAVLDAGPLLDNPSMRRMPLPNLKSFRVLYGLEQEPLPDSAKQRCGFYIRSWLDFPDDTHCPIVFRANSI